MSAWEWFFSLALVALGLLLVYVIISDWKDILASLYRGLHPLDGDQHFAMRLLSLPIWLVLYLAARKYPWIKGVKEKPKADDGVPDFPYPMDERLEVPFGEGKKYICFEGVQEEDIRNAIDRFQEIASEPYEALSFLFHPHKNMVECPAHINFFDFNLLVMDLQAAFPGKVYGVFKHPRLTFFLYPDSRTLNNMIGKTASGQTFSIDMYKVGEGAYLNLYSGLDMHEPGWIREKCF